eukprot:12999647-Alexandrium_andersonii.AAC.1
MSASLVGSEMCIRDRCARAGAPPSSRAAPEGWHQRGTSALRNSIRGTTCLLYTSDAADDM